MSEKAESEPPSGKMVRIPTAFVERAQNLAPALEASPLGGAIRWTDAALIRLAVSRGLDELERALPSPRRRGDRKAKSS